MISQPDDILGKRCGRSTAGFQLVELAKFHGRKLVDAAVWMTGGDGFECGLEPCERLDAVQFRRLDERGEPTTADVVLDRIVHNAYRIVLKGESQRKRNKPPPLDGGDGNRAPA